jgi:hypothetical protein
MTTLNCEECGAALLPGTNFCRQCGAPIASHQSTAAGERSTTVFDEADLVATQRLDPRPTSPGHDRPKSLTCSTTAHKLSKFVLIAVVVLLCVAGIIGLAAIRMRKQHRIASGEAFIYPGAYKSMDIVAEGDARAVELQTSDSFDSVAEWYRKTLKPEKVVRLTADSMVLKNKNVTATIVTERDKTHVLLKIVPQ